MTRHLLIGLSFAALAGGCSGTAHDPVYTAFHREAGLVIDNGEFGNATMNNTQLMTGEKQYTYDLAQRFASEVVTVVNFEFNSADLNPAARATLGEQANFIRQFPELTFRVYGHTDKVGSAAYNYALGLKRAQAVVHFLTAQGIDRSRLEALVSFGETQPLVVTEGKERRNRRTVTEVSGFVSSHPTVLNGKYAEVIYREYVRSAQPATVLTGVSGGDFTLTGNSGN